MNHQPALDPDLIDALRELSDGDPAFLHDLLETFERNSAHVVSELRAAVIFSNRVVFGRAVHELAGSAMSIGAMTLSTICRDCELSMARGSALPTATDLERIIDELNRVLYETRDLSLDNYTEALRVS